MTHAHSSRSHAFLTLHLDKRTLENKIVVKTESVSISLVDLAGSEKFDSASTQARQGANINAGLLALGKVLTGLCNSSSYVPFRDSLLTTMLRDSLEAPATVTYVLACLNPGLEQFSETRNVLQYVYNATQSRLHGAEDGEGEGEAIDAAKEDGELEEEETDPMAGDVFDSDDALNRRTERIETVSFGSIYARCAGDPSEPLILYLHGTTSSKSRGSTSRMYNGLITSVAAEVEQLEKQAQTAAREAEKLASKQRSASPPKASVNPADDSSQEGSSMRGRARGKKRRTSARRVSLSDPEEVNGEVHDKTAEVRDAQFGALRTSLALALRARQKELLKQTNCSRCGGFLLRPTRLLGCRHVLCQLCFGQTVMYFTECPVCLKTFETRPKVDLQHDEVLRIRLSSLRTQPVSITSDLQRLDVEARERDRSIRLLLQVGCERPLSEDDLNLHFYVHLVPTSTGSFVHGGQASAFSEFAARGASLFVDHVTFASPSRSPDAPPPKEGDPGYLSSPTDDQLGFCYHRPERMGRKSSIVVHWSSWLNAAPVEIRWHGAAADRSSIRLVVQLPPSTNPQQVTSGKQTDPRHDPIEGGVPIVYNPDDHVPLASGWVRYQHGIGNHRAQGLPEVIARKKQAGAEAGGRAGQRAVASAKELSSRWLERLVDDTDEAASEAVGHIRDVQTEIVLGASRGIGLEALMDHSSSRGVPLRDLMESARHDKEGKPQEAETKPGGASVENSARTTPTPESTAAGSVAAGSVAAGSVAARSVALGSGAVGSGAAASGAAASGMLLLRSVCDGLEPAVKAIRDEMEELLRDQPETILADMLRQELKSENTDDANRPKSFYQVAIDVPGYGQSDLVDGLRAPGSEGFVNLRLLGEVVQSLGKEHAYAMVACAQGVSALFSALLKAPHLTSFVVLREPDVSAFDTDALHGVLHPTLAPYDHEGPVSMVRSARVRRTGLELDHPDPSAGSEIPPLDHPDPCAGSEIPPLDPRTLHWFHSVRARRHAHKYPSPRTVPPPPPSSSHDRRSTPFSQTSPAQSTLSPRTQSISSPLLRTR